VECINVLGKKTMGYAGDEIVVAIKKAASSKNASIPLKKGDVAHALVVRCKKEVMRKDGTRVRFNDNAVVMINKDRQPIGNRIMGVIAAECRQKRWAKIVSLAPRIV
jgi:large subunit ribosomal protein L14